MAESSLWRQIPADIFNESIRVPTLLAGANHLGAAIVVGVGAGIFKDFRVIEKLAPVTFVQEPIRDSEIRKRYEKLFRLFKASYQALLPVFEAL